jgi:predicted ABC-type ATPase
MTVFSDPVGEKVAFLKSAVSRGYTVVVCFIGLETSELSEQRVAMRVSQGGHDVPSDKLKSRFPRTMANLKAAIVQLPHVFDFDNSDLAEPFKLVAVFENAVAQTSAITMPKWMKAVLPNKC